MAATCCLPANSTATGYYLLDLAKAEAVQLTEGAGDNTFGGFLSPDDKSLYYVKNDRTLLEVNLTTLQEREVYRVADDWVGYGTWVANSDCTKLVGIEIAKKRLDAAQRLADFP